MEHNKNMRCGQDRVANLGMSEIAFIDFEAPALSEDVCPIEAELRYGARADRYEHGRH
jgi:hypothetical protein